MLGPILVTQKDVPVAACHNHVTRQDFWWQVATNMPHAKDVPAAWGQKRLLFRQHFLEHWVVFDCPQLP